MSDTPRTDDFYGPNGFRTDEDSKEFALQLERELAETKAKLAEAEAVLPSALKAKLESCESELKAARLDNAALRDALSLICGTRAFSITGKAWERCIRIAESALCATDTSGYVKADVMLSVKTELEEIIRAGETMPEDALEVTVAKRAISRIDAELKGDK